MRKLITAATLSLGAIVLISLNSLGQSGMGGGQSNIGGGGGGTPGGSNGQVQYNNNGAFGGLSGIIGDGNATQGLAILNGACIRQPSTNNGICFNSSSGIFGLNGAISASPFNNLRFKIQDQGSCTMAAGACAAQSLGSTYAAAPICQATVITSGGTPATPLRAPSTTTTVTPQTGGATDTSVVGWVCFGN